MLQLTADFTRTSLVTVCLAMMLPSTALPSEADRSQSSTDCMSGASDLPTERWARDMREKDLADVMALLAPQPIFVDPSGKAFRGRRSVRNLYSRVFRRFDSNIVLTEVTRGPEADGCVQAGTYWEDLRTRSSGTVTHLVGRFKFSYAPQPNGNWWIARQEWSVLSTP
jgi:ketosteroid isomerase-like protein